MQPRSEVTPGKAEPSPSASPQPPAQTTTKATTRTRPTGPASPTKSPPSPPSLQVSLTKQNLDKYLSSYPKVFQAMGQPRTAERAAPPADPNAWREQMAKWREESEAAAAKALGGSGLTPEAFWSLDRRVRLASRRLRQEEGGDSASAESAGGGWRSKVPPSGEKPGAAPAGKGAMSEEWRQSMEARRKQMEKEMASLTPQELALVKASRQRIESLWEKTPRPAFGNRPSFGGKGSS